MSFKRTFIRVLVLALTVSAAIGIFIFLFGDFGETESKILVTTLTIGGFSLTGLCCATLENRENLKPLSVIGMIISVLAFFFTTASIWEIIDIDNVWKLLLTLIILSFATAHISLLLLVRPKTKNIKYIQTATIVFISIVTLMLIQAVVAEFENEDFFYRLLGVFSILDVLGTIATPILNKITEQKD